jgi:predicted transcriptional regulator
MEGIQKVVHEVEPSYYAIIPSSVRYNNKIPANAKLLYGEITALCNKKGFCYASNKYFANLYNVANNTASSWISSLVSEGFIRIFVDQDDGNKRKIWLTSKGNVPEGIKEKVETSTSKPVENNKENNIKNILTEIKTIWNDAFKDTNVPTIISIDGTRRTHIIKRFKDNKWSISNWSSYISKIKKSKFLLGEETSWCVTFDWVINPTNMTKILEGNYEKESPIIEKKTHFTEYKLDTTGNARIGYCSMCGDSNFYDPFKIAVEDSNCSKKCKAQVLPTKPERI